MLTPSYLEKLPITMVELIDELQNEIIADITKHVIKGKYDSPSAEWLTYKANQLRLSSKEINRIIAKNAKMREREVRRLYTEAVKLALSEDAEIYRYAIAENIIPDEYGNRLTSYFRSIAFNDVFKAGLRRTNGLMRNLTGSMAAAANRTLSDALDLAWLEVTSGAYSRDEACYNAASKLISKGIPVVRYESGRTDQVDVAVRRAIITGINKTCGDMQLGLAAEMDSDLVYVDEHLGARPSHAEWQGAVYSLSGKSKKYPDFRSSTGYGTGEGLCGWNCSHNFFPYFEELPLPDKGNYTDEENAEAYRLSQQQRAYERAVRKSKRELIGTDAARNSTDSPELKAKLDKESARKSAVLKKREERLSQFCRDNRLYNEGARTRTVGFDRSISRKAVSINKKILTLGDGDATIGLRVYQFKQDIANGKINTAVDISNQQKHIYGKTWKNQVKQAIQAIKTDPDTKLKPKSVLAKEIDPQQIIDKYAGKGDGYIFKGKNKYPDEFITLPFVAGRTYDKKAGKYVETHKVQIKYNEKKGTHIFPVLEKGE